MIRRPISIKHKIVLGVLSIALLSVGYLRLSHLQHIENPNDRTIPNIQQFSEAVDKITAINPRDGERWIVEDSKASFSRFAVGMVSGVVVSIILGVLMGSWSWIESILYPPLSAFCKVPATAAIAVFFVLVGVENFLILFGSIIAFTVIPPLTLSIFLTVKEIPEQQIDKTYTLGACNTDIIFNVIAPQIWPKVIDHIRLIFGLAIVVLIAAEMIVGDIGFGYRIRIEQRKLNMDVIYLYLMILMAFGFLLDSSLKLIQRKMFSWYNGGNS